MGVSACVSIRVQPWLFIWVNLRRFSLLVLWDDTDATENNFNEIEMVFVMVFLKCGAQGSDIQN